MKAELGQVCLFLLPRLTVKFETEYKIAVPCFFFFLIPSHSIRTLMWTICSLGLCLKSQKKKISL